MKKFLFVTYYYPPAGGPSVQRIIRIIQFMAENGWECQVLTVKHGDYTTVDPGLEKRIPDSTRVERVDFFEPYRWYRKFTGKKTDEKIPLAVLSAHEKASFKERLANAVRANLFIPDGRIGWYRPGVLAGVRLAWQAPDVRLILSSGPPHTVHLVARRIANITGLPFIADFRDPWVNIDYYHNIWRNPLTVAIDKSLEGKVLRDAAAITVVGPGCRDQILENHPDIPIEKTHIIYNGFDPDVYPKEELTPPADKFVFTYVGNLPFNRYIPAFFQVLKELKREGKINPKKFSLRFFGKIDPKVRAEIEKFDLGDMLQFHDFVPHEQAIRAVVASQLLLLIINDTYTKKGIVPGKMFEYLASKRFVFAIGPVDGDAAKIYQETKAGAFFEYDDVLGMKEFLENFYQKWERGAWQPLTHSEKIDQYRRSRQLRKLFQLFEAFAAKSDEKKPFSHSDHSDNF
ncbi:MAG: glycosyltransferase family 4 protein [Calditrichaeota bacterium]|nr:glycosyltransferase family 4 protein [Calditrichota bacterium]